MKIGVLGTGQVGEAIATALLKKGHSVRMGSRTAKGEKGLEWAKKGGENASLGDFAGAAAFGDIIFICLNGSYTLDVIKSIDAAHLNGKILIDITNPLDFTHGMPPRILEGLGNSTSLGEEIQKIVPYAFVVKTLNTVNYKLMVDAHSVNKGDHNLFICGDNRDAKNKMAHFLVDTFGWRAENILDLGGIQSSRAIEAIVPFWVLVYQSLGTPLFNFKIVK